MGDMSKEPSMEDILSSIRRVIEREDAARGSAPAAAADDMVHDELDPAHEPLELTEASQLPDDEDAADRAVPIDSMLSTEDDDDAIVSPDAASASRRRLASLARLSGDAQPSAAPAGSGRTVDDLALAALRPMLKEWLDANLPDLVERIVAREVARITRFEP